MPFKGVINADSGDIVIRPRVQDMDLKRNLSFISKALAEDRSRRSGERCGFRDLGDWPLLFTYVATIDECVKGGCQKTD